MLSTVIKKNSYQDSINLMLLTNVINALPGVTKSQIMMGTDANKDIFRGAGLLTDEAAAASPSDMVIVVDSERKETVDEVLAFPSRRMPPSSPRSSPGTRRSRLCPMPTWRFSPRRASTPLLRSSMHSTWASTSSPSPTTLASTTRCI